MALFLFLVLSLMSFASVNASIFDLQNADITTTEAWNIADFWGLVVKYCKEEYDTLSQCPPINKSIKSRNPFAVRYSQCVKEV